MWMNPPIVYELTIPSSHSTSKITKTVHSMRASLSRVGCLVVRTSTATCDQH
jgi:hypothetical protein